MRKSRTPFFRARDAEKIKLQKSVGISKKKMKDAEYEWAGAGPLLQQLQSLQQNPQLALS